ncbi:surfeit locus protein 1-like [Carica papaya]|uniref:surfeit locus protein 1-like n=1 Tax=Carica papaya TaxID=3649 RepID=UPI000B8CB0E8|nr:surfeit locus protein 1-like [Carica papaya]
MEPMKFNSTSLASETLDSLEFRRVVVKGIFDEGKSIYVGPRSRSISGVTENGYYVITPLMPLPNNPESVQSPILVNRGWVPRSWREKPQEVSKDAEQPSNKASLSLAHSDRGSWWKFWSKKPENVEDQVHAVTLVEVVGVIRGSERPSIFVPANEPDSSQWFYVDVPAIARASGLPGDTIYIEDINENVNPSNPYPVPKDVNTLIRSSVMPQDHLNYTLTWYAFYTFLRITAKKTSFLGEKNLWKLKPRWLQILSFSRLRRGIRLILDLSVESCMPESEYECAYRGRIIFLFLFFFLLLSLNNKRIKEFKMQMKLQNVVNVLCDLILESSQWKFLFIEFYIHLIFLILGVNNYIINSNNS